VLPAVSLCMPALQGDETAMVLTSETQGPLVGPWRAPACRPGFSFFRPAAAILILDFPESIW